MSLKRVGKERIYIPPEPGPSTRFWIIKTCLTTRLFTAVLHISVSLNKDRMEMVRTTVYNQRYKQNVLSHWVDFIVVVVFVCVEELFWGNCSPFISCGQNTTWTKGCMAAKNTNTFKPSGTVPNNTIPAAPSPIKCSLSGCRDPCRPLSFASYANTLFVLYRNSWYHMKTWFKTNRSVVLKNAMEHWKCSYD